MIIGPNAARLLTARVSGIYGDAFLLQRFGDLLFRVSVFDDPLFPGSAFKILTNRGTASICRIATRPTPTGTPGRACPYVPKRHPAFAHKHTRPRLYQEPTLLPIS